MKHIDQLNASIKYQFPSEKRKLQNQRNVSTVENVAMGEVKREDDGLGGVKGAKALLVNGANDLVLGVDHDACGGDLAQEVLFPVKPGKSVAEFWDLGSTQGIEHKARRQDAHTASEHSNPGDQCEWPQSKGSGGSVTRGRQNTRGAF